MEHHFNIKIAKELGIEEAILIHHFHYWVYKNAANEKHFHDGTYWTYNSKRAFAELFPYMNETKIGRVIKKLEDRKIIKKSNFNEDKWDRTNWYAFTDDGIKLLNNANYNVALLQNATMDCAKMNNGLCKNEQSLLINNTNSNTNSKEEDTNVSSKKTDYKAIIDCWNETNGKRLGKVTAITDKRKKLIKHLMDEHSINEKQLIMYIKTIPSADSWLYNPNKQHANWKPDFDWWMRNTNSWFTKLTEGKLHTENPQTFALIVDGQDAPYTPSGNFSLMWDEPSNAYMYIGYYYDGMDLADGYTDDTRPNGAKIILNNARGTIIWNSQTKKWEHD